MDARAHKTHTLLHQGTHTHTHWSDQLKNRMLSLTGSESGRKKHGVVWLHSTETFGFWPQRLCRSAFFFFFFWQKDRQTGEGGSEGWGELNGNPSPRGRAKAERCWNKWFMLLSSQVNSAALSAIANSFSGQEGNKKNCKKSTVSSLLGLCSLQIWMTLIHTL